MPVPESPVSFPSLISEEHTMRRRMILAACLAIGSLTAAQKGAPVNLLEAVNAGPEGSGATHFVTPTIVSSTQNLGSTTMVLDITGEESWDLLDDPNNHVLVVPLGAGASMTGIGWDVNLQTLGGSWLSEARFYFDGSDHDLSGLFLTPGFAFPNPGTMAFSSGGPLDLSDNGIPDIPILGDGNLYIQLYEGFDDIPDGVDANWIESSTLTIVYDGGAPAVPTVGEWGMILLGVTLLGGVVVVSMRRKRLEPALATD
jgi:hypothetical protein